jgi:glycosyltransferase involved in cell wall biosynthesis
MTGSPWLDWPVLIATLIWVGRAVLVRRSIAALVPLPGVDSPPPAPRDGWPRVSIIVASRNEAENVLAGVGSLLDLAYPDYEVVAVNDRSTDATGDRLEELARRDSRVRVVHLREVPEGWIGKTNALSKGAELSTAPWFLFTDADVRFLPGVIERAVARCLDENLDFLTLFPEMGARSIWMKSFHALALGLAGLLLGLWAPIAWRRRFPMGGAGAFMLVRRDAYEGAGGHASIRLRVVDDLALGFLLHRFRGKTSLAMAQDWLSVPYAPTIPDLIRVTRKNAFAILGYSWLSVLALTLVTISLDVLAPLSFCIHWKLWPCSTAVWLAMWASYSPTWPIAKAPRLCFLLHPILSVILLVPIWTSALAVTREGGVRWRESFYPLAMLKRGG